MSDSEFISSSQHEQEEVLFDSGGTCDCYRLVKGNRIYCVKRPKMDMLSLEAYMNLFRKEFELGIELEHPNIVRYFAYDEDENGPYIRMDYIDGDSLEAFVAQHPDYFKEKGHRKQFCDELFSALSYLHDKNMLHLDLKPSNILITNKGHHVKLIDLGFGWGESYLHDVGFTRDYCAPEQQVAKTELFGPATDIYALGKILQRFGLAKNSITQRCLKEDPRARYQSVDALRKAMQRSETIRISSRVGLGLVAAMLIGAVVWLVGFREKPLPPRPPAPEGAINGLFTINEAGDQVYFSKGNLQYIGSADTPYWKFAENQWDYLEKKDGPGDTSRRADRDLFGWGTSGYDHGAVHYQPWHSSLTDSDYYAYGVDTCNLYDQSGVADWGYNAISNGGNQVGQWRTLSKDEWFYLLMLRPTASHIRFAKATVNGIGGVILVPDNWDNSSRRQLSFPDGGGYFGSNIIIAKEWQDDFETNGAVFLPAAGAFLGDSLHLVGSYGYYWSSSSYDDGKVGRLDFNSFLLYPNSPNNRYTGAVRLVRDR